MPDLDERFRGADLLRVPDLWTDISTRTPGPPLGGSRRRVVAALTALAVAAVGIALAVSAFRHTRPTGRPTGGRSP